jgi:hypothetical protein
MDPRVKSTPQELQRQFDLESKLSRALARADQAAREIHEARALGNISAELEKKLAGASGRRGGEEESASAGEPHVTLAQLSGNFAQLLSVADSADAAPTTQVSAAAEQSFRQLDGLLQEWQTVKK